MTQISTDDFNHKISLKVWKYEGKAGWFFVSIPWDMGQKMQVEFGRKRGWNSVPVTVQVGTSIWATSIFPDTKTKAYLLPLKADVRKKQNIREHDVIDVLCRVRGRKS